MFIMAATVSSWERIRVGPKMTPRLDTVIRLDWLCVETLQVEDKGSKRPFCRDNDTSSLSGGRFPLYHLSDSIRNTYERIRLDPKL